MHLISHTNTRAITDTTSSISVTHYNINNRNLVSVIVNKGYSINITYFTTTSTSVSCHIFWRAIYTTPSFWIGDNEQVEYMTVPPGRTSFRALLQSINKLIEVKIKFVA